jgi:hypothetical protein
MEKALEDARGAAPSRESMVALAESFRCHFGLVQKNIPKFKLYLEVPSL